VAPTPVVVNAAEGEPGTYKDRALVEENPYQVLEGALIAVDVHRTILELERRVLPELQHHLDAADDERLLAAELTELP
jgi:NADH:ubiquinone oxidoreductase subunit F (NADH-binding)